MKKHPAEAEPRRTRTLEAIIRYWRAQGAPIGVGWDKAADHCWRCGKRLIWGTREGHTEDDAWRHRAHIVPRCLGGSDDASNIIILCRQCHVLAPDVADPGFMWEWLQTPGASDPQMAMMREAYVEYETLFGRFPVPEEFRDLFEAGGRGRRSLFLASSDLDEAQKRVFYERGLAVVAVVLRDLVGLHQGKLSASTMAWALHQVVLYAGRQPSLVSTLLPEPPNAASGSDGTREQQRTIFDFMRGVEGHAVADGAAPDELKDRVSALCATVERFLPGFVKIVAGARGDGRKAEMVVLHQDAFAAGYDEDEYALLGMAVKYAGLHGVTVTVIGGNRETL
jgi:hypothetical protein